MARCYLTGVEFPVDHGFVLNRSEAHRLLRALRTRAESLERLIVQLAPMDTPSEERATAMPRVAGKQHRMVCKAVADAIGTTCPEISLFLSWSQLVSYRTVMRMRLLKDHPLYGPALSDLAEAECVPVDQLGRRVLAMIDPHRKWSPRVRLAIAAGVCVRNRHASAVSLAATIRATISSDGDLSLLGVPDAECEAVRLTLKQVRPARSADPATDEPARQPV